MVFCPEHAKRDQNLKFTLLSETTSIPAPFIWEFPTPGVERVQQILQSIIQRRSEVILGDSDLFINVSSRLDESALFFSDSPVAGKDIPQTTPPPLALPPIKCLYP